MVDKKSIMQIFGSLMKCPQYLSETDKYTLTLDDFSQIFDKYIFMAIDNLYRNGAKRITPIDIENFLDTNATAKQTFAKNNGIEYLQDADYLTEEQNFPYYYNRLKKFNLLNALKKMGIDTNEFYNENLADVKALDTNEKFEQLSIDQILETVKRKVLKLEKTFVQNETTETESAFTDIQDIIDDADAQIDIGFPLQGDIFNEVLSGARKGTLVVRSAGSGTGKTRNSVGDACYLAYPLRYEPQQEKWVQTGSVCKVLIIVTEQNFKEVRKMILAYLTGFNESKFRYGNFSDREKEILKQAVWLMQQYEDNLYIVRMPNPTIELVKSIVRENCLMRNIEYVFYDYIFIGPSLLNEFKGFNLRNDEVLLMFATALKDLAVELNIFVMTSTQVNANADNNTNIRNESSIAGSRSIINKADIGCVMARPTREELDALQESVSTIGILPNLVTDIYKVRSGEWNQVRIWSYVDLGNLRKKDLFVTDSRLAVLDNTFTSTNFNLLFDWNTPEWSGISDQCKYLNEGDWSE